MTNELTQNEILDIATIIGYYILKNGGETSRAEDTVERIGRAYGIDTVHVFAIASSIVISMESDGVSISQTRRVRGISTDLTRLDKLNSLSRKICESTPSHKDVIEQIHEIEKTPVYPLWVMVLAFAVIGGSFAVFFGGGMPECLAAFVIGAILRFVIFFSEKLKSNPFFTNVLGSAVTVSLTQLFSLICGGINSEIINIGVLMNLVPGVLLTNCIRDFVATDYVAGISKILETLFIAAAIALGVSVSLLWR